MNIDQQSELADAGHDDGRARGKRERRCALTRQMLPVDDLVRFVAGPDGNLIPDLKAVLPGRGVWIAARHGAVSEAVRRQVFARALKKPVTVSLALADEVETLLRRRACEALSLATKAGQVAFGFVQAESALKKGALALLHAVEAAEDGCSKLDRLFRAIHGPTAKIMKVLSIRDFDLALGRSNVIHAALLNGSAAQACLARLVLLSAYRETGNRQLNG